MGNTNFETVRTNILTRRTCPPATFNDQAVEQQIVEQILECAHWAPNHKKTEPWRFVVFHSEESRSVLADFLSNTYKAITPEDKFSPATFGKLQKNALKAAAVVALVFQRHEDAVPEWEETAALGAAAQNILLAAHAAGLSAIWSTPGVIKEFGKLETLAANEICRGFIYLGYSEQPAPLTQRSPLDQKVTWK